MTAAEEYLMRGKLTAPVPQQQQKREGRGKKEKPVWLRPQGCHRLEKSASEQRHSDPSEAHGKELELQQGRRRKDTFKAQRNQARLSTLL